MANGERCTRRDRRALSALTGALVLALCSSAGAAELRTNMPVLGQVRDGYLSGDLEAPIELYGDLGISGLRHGTTLDTYFRLEEDFANLEGKTQFFSGVLRVPAAVPNLDVQLGRQIVAEAPLNIFDADSGQVRVGLGGPFSATVFGGQPRYWEPTYGTPGYSDDEQIFGGSLRMARFQSGALALGYLQQNRQGREIKQLVTGTGTRSFPTLPGLPNLYSNVAYDADHQNLDLVRAGVQSFVWRPQLLMNFESSYYKPQDNGKTLIDNVNRREDPVFQVFSLSQMLQFRGGVRYGFTPTVSAYGDLSYQRYEQLAGSYIDGYVWSGGLLYLPGGDGLEVVRTEYYGIDSGGGTVNGVRGYYENRVYDRILFHAKCDVAYYEKATNQSDTAVGSLLGLGYVLLPGLVAEVNFEANRNQLFPEDFRFGFFIIYNGRYQTDDGLRRVAAGSDQRPWPWGPTQFGTSAWGTGPARWTADPGLPSSWGSNQSYASAGLGGSAANPADWIPKPDTATAEPSAGARP